MSCNFFKLKIVLFLSLLCSTSFVTAQVVDTIQASLQSKAKFTFKFDTRNSFIANSRAEIFGFKAGVEFGKRLRVGGGLNTLISNLYKDKYIANQNGFTDTISEKLSFNYWSYYVEYVYYKTKRWEFSVPLQIGIGDSRYEYIYEGKKTTENKKVVLLYEPSISAQYLIFNWLGLGTDIGIRFMLRNNRAIKENFNSPTYSFKVLIFYSEIYKGLFPHSKLAEKL